MLSKVEGKGPIDPPPPLMPSCNFFYLMRSRVKSEFNKLNLLDLIAKSHYHDWSLRPNLRQIPWRDNNLE